MAANKKYTPEDVAAALDGTLDLSGGGDENDTPPGHHKTPSEMVTLSLADATSADVNSGDFLDEETRSMLSEMSAIGEVDSTEGRAPGQRSAVIMVQITIPGGTKPAQELKARTSSGIRIIAKAPSDWSVENPARVIQVAVPRDSPPGSVIRAKTPSGFGVKALVPENWTRQAARRKSKIMDPLGRNAPNVTNADALRSLVNPQEEEEDTPTPVITDTATPQSLSEEKIPEGDEEEEEEEAPAADGAAA
eukprot:scaffold1809_cov228-Pinguiococcus_pyrenoidosus.AAC.5